MMDGAKALVWGASVAVYVSKLQLTPFPTSMYSVWVPGISDDRLRDSKNANFLQLFNRSQIVDYNHLRISYIKLQMFTITMTNQNWTFGQIIFYKQIFIFCIFSASRTPSIIHNAFVTSHTTVCTTLTKMPQKDWIWSFSELNIRK